MIVVMKLTVLLDEFHHFGLCLSFGGVRSIRSASEKKKMIGEVQNNGFRELRFTLQRSML